MDDDQEMLTLFKRMPREGLEDVCAKFFIEFEESKRLLSEIGIGHIGQPLSDRVKEVIQRIRSISSIQDSCGL